MILLLVALQATPEPALFEVELRGVGRIVVEAAVTADSLIQLPGREVYALLGLTRQAPAWITPEALATEERVTVDVDWRRSLVLVHDNLGVTPAYRALTDRKRRDARGLPQLSVVSAPFAILTADERGDRSAEVGYSWRGRIAASLYTSSLRPSRWALSVSPSKELWLAYADRALSGRLALGPLWLSAVRTPDRTTADALVALGRLSLYAASRGAVAVTWRGTAFDLQVGKEATGRITTRLSVGPVPLSPFTVPTIR